MSHVTADENVHPGPVTKDQKAPHNFTASRVVLQINFCCPIFKLYMLPDLG